VPQAVLLYRVEMIEIDGRVVVEPFVDANGNLARNPAAGDR